MTTRKIEYLLFQHFFKQSKLVTFRITRNIRIVNHECDVLIVNKQNYLVEFEIKISKEDLKKDLTKKHQHKDNRIRQVNFIVPERLYQDCLELVDKNFGIWIVNDRNEVWCKRKAKINKAASSITIDTLLKLYRLDSMKKITYLKALIDNNYKI